MVYSNWIDELRDIVGSAHVTRVPERLNASGFPAGKGPEVLVFPGTPEEVQEIVILANKKSVPVIPVGGGTSIKKVLTPHQGGIGLSLCRLNRILEMEADNLSVRAEAGVLNGDIQEVVKAHNLFLPVYPDCPHSTLGGEVSGDLGSRKRYRYGSMGDYVLGLEFVTPEGQLVKTGGKTVKNASGYDFIRLLAGSWGTTGVITSAILRLKPLPEQEKVLVVEFKTAVEALHIGQKIMAERLSIVSLDLMCSAGTDTCLAVAIEGSSEVVVAHSKKVRRFFEGRNIKSYDKNEAALFWTGFHGMRRIIQDGINGMAVFDKRLLGEFSAAISWINDYRGTFHLDIGAGVLEFSLPGQTEEFPEKFVRHWEALEKQMGSGLRTSFLPSPAQPLSDKLLAKIDPRGIMFPGNRLLRGVNRG